VQRAYCLPSAVADKKSLGQEKRRVPIAVDLVLFVCIRNTSIRTVAFLFGVNPLPREEAIGFIMQYILVMNQNDLNIP
jgi:uncharacterized protein YydD (DUF2326 family)